MNGGDPTLGIRSGPSQAGHYRHRVRTQSPAGLPAALTRLAPVLLGASVAVRLIWTYLAPNGTNFVDLHVYLGAAAALDEPGTLYSYVYGERTPDFPLPFTYPPFAALVFYPLSRLPFGPVALAWQIGTIAALYGVVRVSQRMSGVPAGAGHRRAMLWTAAGIWTEPVRSTLDYGQINVFLVLAVLWAARSTRWWLSGLLVGVAAGIKLTPAVAGLYLVGMRRFAAAAFSALVFAATVALSIAVIGEQARYYFTDLLGDTGRVGPIGTVFNQSWRGAVSRIIGQDAGYGPLVLVGVAVTLVLAGLAWRALDAGDGETGPGSRDRLGSLLVVELAGLLISPIAWTHHWIWVLPLIIWLIDGPRRNSPGARALGWGWLALTLVGVPWLLGFAQPTIWDIGRPWYLAWAAPVYLAAVLVTLGWIALSARAGSGRSLRPSERPCR